MKLLFVNFLLVFSLMGGARSKPGPVIQNKIEFRNPTVENQYPEGMAFGIEICGRPSPMRVVFNYLISEALYWEKDIETVYEGKTSDKCDQWKYLLDARADYIPPFSPVKYAWSVIDGTTSVGRSSDYVYYYRDTTYQWNTIANERLAIWWHDRPDQFGADVMYTASRAYEEQAKFYSSSLESPVTIVIVNTEPEFFAWQEEESDAGGFAFSDISLTIQLVEDSPAYYDWVSEVIPHEISHIYFSHLVKRYSGATYWLDEGMATYNEYSDHLREWETVKTALDTDKLLALKDLEYDFGEENEKVDLAYAESYYAILYMDEVYGRDSISTLLYEYSKGTRATYAFDKSFGRTPEQFESDFIAWLPERVKTLPPNTDIPQPPHGRVHANPESGNIPAWFLFEICLVSGFVLLLIVILLGSGYGLMKRKRKTGMRP